MLSILHRAELLRAPRARLRLAQLIVEHGWSVAAAAKPFMVAWTTAKRWEQRYREHGKDGMNDRPSRPRTSPNRTTTSVVKKIVSLRWRQRLGPVQIACRLGLAASTVHAVLKRCRINRLRYIDRVTGERIRRYEHPYPGAMIHVDVTKFGNIPTAADTGSWDDRPGNTTHGSLRTAPANAPPADIPGWAPPSCTP